MCTYCSLLLPCPAVSVDRPQRHTTAKSALLARLYRARTALARLRHAYAAGRPIEALLLAAAAEVAGTGADNPRQPSTGSSADGDERETTSASVDRVALVDAHAEV